MFEGEPPPLTYSHSTSKYAETLKHSHLYYKGLVDRGNDFTESIHAIVYNRP